MPRLIDLDKMVSIYDEDNNTVIFGNLKTAEVKAIPIDWLQQQAEYYQRAYEAEVEENGFDAGRYYIQMYNAINTLIDTWESENG